MGRVLKLLLLVALVGAAAAAISFAGAFMKMKSYLGDNLPSLGSRQASFLPKAQDLEGNPMVWRFHYSRTQMQGLPSITIYVSPGGTIVATVPGNLNARLEPHRQRMP